MVEYKKMFIVEDIMIIRKSRLLLAITALFLITLSACVVKTPPLELKIHFNSNGGTLIQSIVYDGQQMITIPSNPTKEGYTFDGWYWDNTTFVTPFTTNSLLNEPLEDDLIVYAKWEPVIYSITYVLNGGVNPENNPATFVIGTTLSILEPTKEGFTFGGWFKDADLKIAFTDSTTPAENITLFAKWKILSNEPYAVLIPSDGELISLTLSPSTPQTILKIWAIINNQSNTEYIVYESYSTNRYGHMSIYVVIDKFGTIVMADFYVLQQTRYLNTTRSNLSAYIGSNITTRVPQVDIITGATGSYDTVLLLLTHIATSYSSIET